MMTAIREVGNTAFGYFTKDGTASGFLYTRARIILCVDKELEPRSPHLRSYTADPGQNDRTVECCARELAHLLGFWDGGRYDGLLASKRIQPNHHVTTAALNQFSTGMAAMMSCPA